VNELLLQVLRVALPLVLATTSEVVAERGGVVNLSLEGTMLCGALTAFLVAAGGGGAMLLPALLAAALVGVATAALLALFVVKLRADAIVAGAALHFVALGATGLLFERMKTSASVTTFSTIGRDGEGGGFVAWLPYLGELALVVGVTWLLQRTRLGLAIRAAGDAPAALRAAGGSPARARVVALLIAGAIGGLAGATLTTVLTGTFVEGMTNGRGFLALALVLFARWNALGALAAGLFVGGAQVLELRVHFDAAQRGLVFGLRALPYVLTIAALALSGSRRADAPGALGKSLEG
jgi:simple sugar transport system permease protein